MKSHPNDINVLGDGKRCISVLGILSDAMQTLQSIPGKLSCFFFGNCEADNGGNDGSNDEGDESDNSDNGDGEEEEGAAEEDGEDGGEEDE